MLYLIEGGDVTKTQSLYEEQELHGVWYEGGFDSKKAGLVKITQLQDSIDSVKRIHKLT